MASPLSPAVLQILLALTDGKRHGYAIAQEAAEQSNGRVRLAPGTLYGTLQRLQDLGWVSATEAPAGVDERRRYYRLTGAGRAALEGEISLMESLVRRARLSRPRPATSRS